jgi:hypothetical protein
VGTPIYCPAGFFQNDATTPNTVTDLQSAVNSTATNALNAATSATAAASSATSAGASQTAAATSATNASTSATAAAASASAASTSASAASSSATTATAASSSAATNATAAAASQASATASAGAASASATSASSSATAAAASAASASASATSINQTQSFRNKLINGTFSVWQRGTSITMPVSGNTADQWQLNSNGFPGVGTLGQYAMTEANDATMLAAGIVYGLSYANTTASSGETYHFMEDRIEGPYTLAGQTVTVSFYARTTSGTATMSAQVTQFGGSTSGSGGSYYSTAQQAFTATTAWQRFTYTVNLTAASGITVGADGNGYVAAQIGFPINATWPAIIIAGAQLEVGSSASPFETRPPGLELDLALRYFETVPILMAGYDPVGGKTFSAPILFRALKRIQPANHNAGLPPGGAVNVASTALTVVSNAAALLTVVTTASGAFSLGTAGSYQVSAEL